MFLKPDKIINLNNIRIKQFLLTDSKNNPNNIELPTKNRSNTVAITVHNTGAIEVAKGTTMAEQYVRATYNGCMNDVRVHYYVDQDEIWQCLPDELINWSCADGTSNPNSGNNTSIAIEVIGDNLKAEDNCAQLVAYLLNKYELTVENGLRTHTYWLNKLHGRNGTIDELNIMHNSYKNCPIYIIPHWNDFKNKVQSYYNGIAMPAQCVDNFNSIHMTYCVYSDKWLPEVVDTQDYAGNDKPIKLFMTKSEKCELKYRVHLLHGGWLSWINGYDKHDLFHGYAGLPTDYIDGLQIMTNNLSYSVKYRVALSNQRFLPWITNNKGYAGIIGQPIYKIQAFIKKNER